MNSLSVKNIHILPIYVGGKIVRYRVTFDIEVEQKPALIKSFPEYGCLKRLDN